MYIDISYMMDQIENLIIVKQLMCDIWSSARMIFQRHLVTKTFAFLRMFINRVVITVLTLDAQLCPGASGESARRWRQPAVTSARLTGLRTDGLLSVGLSLNGIHDTARGPRLDLRGLGCNNVRICYRSMSALTACRRLARDSGGRVYGVKFVSRTKILCHSQSLTRKIQIIQTRNDRIR